MIEPHTRAAHVQNQPHEAWFHFLGSRFVASLKRGGTFAITVQGARQAGVADAELAGILEQSDDASLPVVRDFTGAVNLETREVVIHEAGGKIYRGEFSANGRVVRLRQDGESRDLRLVHEGTLRHLLQD